MKAFLIDTPNHAIVEVDYDGDWKSIYAHIHAKTFELVIPDIVDDIEVSVYVDEEGLINDNPHGFFAIRGIGQALAGYGLVLGCDAEGETVAAPVTKEWLEERVDFLATKVRN